MKAHSKSARLYMVQFAPLALLFSRKIAEPVSKKENGCKPEIPHRCKVLPFPVVQMTTESRVMYPSEVVESLLESVAFPIEFSNILFTVMRPHKLRISGGTAATIMDTATCILALEADVALIRF